MILFWSDFNLNVLTLIYFSYIVQKMELTSILLWSYFDLTSIWMLSYFDLLFLYCAKDWTNFNLIVILFWSDFNLNVLTLIYFSYIVQKMELTSILLWSYFDLTSIWMLSYFDLLFLYCAKDGTNFNLIVILLCSDFNLNEVLLWYLILLSSAIDGTNFNLTLSYFDLTSIWMLS